MVDHKAYYAFISYKREDEKWAKWLQDKLEHYRFPSNLNGRTDLPKNIRPTFRDVTDLNPGLLSKEIDNALRNSKWLIVVCSPRSAKSPWVCKEAQTFIDLGRGDHIIPFVIEGNPFSNDPNTECFPKALLSLTGSRELLAANIHEMGRDAAAVKVVSRMFDLRFDTLWQRYKREQKKKRRMWIASICTLLLLLLFIAFWINGLTDKMDLSQNKVNAQRALVLSENGDYKKACLLATEVLKDVQQETDYSYVAEADAAIRRSTYCMSYVIAELKDYAKHISYSKDGKYFLSSASIDGVKLWDATSDTILLRKTGDDCAVLSPMADRIAISHRNKDIHSFYPIEIKRIKEKGVKSLYLRAHTDIISSLAFNPNGQQLASTAYDGTLIIWDLSSGSIQTKVQVTECVVNSVAFSNSGKYVITAAGDHVFSKKKDHTAKVWDAESGRLLHTLDGHEASVYYALYSPQDKFIVTASEDNTIKIWDATTYSLVHTFYGHTRPIRSVSFSSDGRWMFSASDDKTIKWWDMKTWNLLLTLKGHLNAVYDAQLSPHEDYLLSVSTDKTIRKWDIRTCKILREIISDSLVISVVTDRDKKMIASNCIDSVIRIWDVPNYNLLYSMSGFQDEIQSIDFGENGNVVALTFENTIMIGNIKSEKTFKQTLHGSIYNVLFGTDDKWLIVVYGDSLQIRNVPTMQKELNIECNLSHYYPVFYLSPQKDRMAHLFMGSHIAFANVKDLFNAQTYNMNAFDSMLPGEFKKPVIQVKFSPDEKYLAAISVDELIIWDLRNKKIIEKTETLNGLTSIDFSPNGKTMVITTDKNLVLMDVETQIVIDSISEPDRPIDAIYLNQNTIVYTTLTRKMKKWTFTPLHELLRETNIWLRNEENSRLHIDE